jgi:hypothetical protein
MGQHDNTTVDLITFEESRHVDLPTREELMALREEGAAEQSMRDLERKQERKAKNEAWLFEQKRDIVNSIRCAARRGDKHADIHSMYVWDLTHNRDRANMLAAWLGPWMKEAGYSYKFQNGHVIVDLEFTIDDPIKNEPHAAKNHCVLI